MRERPDEAAQRIVDSLCADLPEGSKAAVRQAIEDAMHEWADEVADQTRQQAAELGS